MNVIKTNRLFDNELMPTSPGVVIYSLFNSNDECIYVGQTTTLKSRVYQHLVSGKEVESFSFFECTKDEANDMEALTIVEKQPSLNKSLPMNNHYCSTAELRKKLNEKIIELDSRIESEFRCAYSKRELVYIKKSTMKTVIGAVESLINLKKADLL